MLIFISGHLRSNTNSYNPRFAIHLYFKTPMSATNNNDTTPLAALLAVVKSGFSTFMESQQAGHPTPIPLQQLLMPLVMGFAGGNWAFLDTVIPHMGGALSEFAASVGGGDFHAGAKSLGAEVQSAVLAMFGSDTNLSALLGGLCTAGADPIAATATNVGLLVEQLIVLAITTFTGASTGLFSDNAKRVVKNFSGGWLEQISGFLVAGRSGLMAFLQAFSTVVTPRVVSLFPPEISMYTMFAAPLIMNLIMQFHQQFVREKESEEADLYA